MSRGETSLVAVSVVVPAHDEELLLERCLRAVAASMDRLVRERPDLDVRSVVVLDDCTDGSALIASRHRTDVLRLRERSVGAARRAGADHLRGRTQALDARHWLACTDADSEVPSDWLTVQVEAAERGARLVLGEVRPCPQELGPDLTRRWLAHLARESGPGLSVHGANLGVRMDAYLAAGGFPAVNEHEDVRLVRALGALGVEAVPGAGVLTSGRRIGRTPGGFAGFLRDLDRRVVPV